MAGKVHVGCHRPQQEARRRRPQNGHPRVRVIHVLQQDGVIDQGAGASALALKKLLALVFFRAQLAVFRAQLAVFRAQLVYMVELSSFFF